MDGAGVAAPNGDAAGAVEPNVVPAPPPKENLRLIKIIIYERY